MVIWQINVLPCMARLTHFGTMVTPHRGVINNYFVHTIQ